MVEAHQTRVYTSAETDAMVQALTDDDHLLAPAPTTGTTSRRVRVRNYVPLPYEIALAMLDRRGMTPVQFWKEFITPLLTSARVDEYEPLIRWASPLRNFLTDSGSFLCMESCESFGRKTASLICRHWRRI